MGQISPLRTRPLVDELEGQIAAADATIACLSADYLSWVRDDLSAMRDAAHQLERALLWGDHLAAAAIAGSLREIAEDLRGQMSAFGYSLIAALAHSLTCTLAEPAEPAEIAAALERRLNALERAVALELKGNGGAVGAALIASLAD